MNKNVSINLDTSIRSSRIVSSGWVLRDFGPHSFKSVWCILSITFFPISDDFCRRSSTLKADTLWRLSASWSSTPRKRKNVDYTRVWFNLAWFEKCMRVSTRTKGKAYIIIIHKLPLPIVVASDMALQTSGLGFDNPN